MRPPPGADACCLLPRHRPRTDCGQRGRGRGGEEEKTVWGRGKRRTQDTAGVLRQRTQMREQSQRDKGRGTGREIQVRRTQRSEPGSARVLRLPTLASSASPPVSSDSPIPLPRPASPSASRLDRHWTPQTHPVQNRAELLVSPLPPPNPPNTPPPKKTNSMLSAVASKTLETSSTPLCLSPPSKASGNPVISNLKKKTSKTWPLLPTSAAPSWSPPPLSPA